MFYNDLFNRVSGKRIREFSVCKEAYSLTVDLLDKHVKLQNIVARVDLGKAIDLEKIARTTSSTIYEPEQFPAVIWRPKAFGSAILIFSTGKLVVAGLKTFSECRSLPKFIEDNLLGHSNK